MGWSQNSRKHRKKKKSKYRERCKMKRLLLVFRQPGDSNYYLKVTRFSHDGEYEEPEIILNNITRDELESLHSQIGSAIRFLMGKRQTDLKVVK